MPDKYIIPQKPVARGDKPGTPIWMPSGGSPAQMRAQAEAVRSIERFVTRMKAERERLTREGRNSED